MSIFEEPVVNRDRLIELLDKIKENMMARIELDKKILDAIEDFKKKPH